jgi:hypothetical protein
MVLALLLRVALAPPWEGAMVPAGLASSDLVTAKGPVTTGTHLYRPWDSELMGSGAAQGKTSRKSDALSRSGGWPAAVGCLGQRCTEQLVVMKLRRGLHRMVAPRGWSGQ